jgi:xylulokinase
MARAATFIGIDVGTQGTKALALDSTSGAIVARASRFYDVLPDLPPGAAEHDPRIWIDAVRDVVRDLLRSGRCAKAEIAGIGVAGQQHGSVVLDSHGEVLRPAKLWCDTTTIEEAAELSRTLGRSIPTGFTAPKLLWMKRHEAALWRRAGSVLLPHDYVNFRLTGELTTEPGDASGTGYFDPFRRAYDPIAIAAIDERLSSMLPAVRESREPAGTLSEHGARLLDLEAGVLVASGGGDNMMSAIGSGATRPGVVTVSLGTSGTAFCYASEPVVDPQGSIAGFCDSTGGYLPLLCTMNVTSVTQEVRGLFPSSTLAELTGLAEAESPGAKGLLFLPYLRGERVPNLPHATGTILGIVPGSLGPGLLFRAAMEGATLALASGIERMKGLGLPVESVRVVGGGAKSPLWRRVLADCLDVPVVGVEEEESAALGAALQALWIARSREREGSTADDVACRYVKTDGSVTEPNADNVPIYREARARLDRETRKIFG